MTTPVIARVREAERPKRPTLYIAMQDQFQRGEGDFRRTSHAFVAPLKPSSTELLIEVPGELESARSTAIAAAKDAVVEAAKNYTSANGKANLADIAIALATLAAAEGEGRTNG